MSVELKPIRSGGLMRCCIATLAEHAGEALSEAEGTVIPCNYCSSSMRVRDGAWEWNHDYDGHGEWPVARPPAGEQP